MVENEEIWTLFGIYSHVFNRNCDPKNQAVFVDVTKFLPWIKKIFRKFDDECGVRKVSKPTKLVVNGTLPYHGEHPWLVSLQLKYSNGQFKHICGASIINEWSLLTGKILI